MSCYHPLKGFIVGRTDKGKDKIKVTSYNVDHLEYNERLNSWKEVYDEKISYGNSVLYNKFEIPCGHCIGCRLDKSRDWANRCLLEMQQYPSNFFVTLTYDNDHVPCSTGCDPDSGELFTTFTLVKRDWQLFMKRLRKAYDVIHPGEKLRFFMCGEYGENTFRPHYHAIIFNLELDDLVWYKFSEGYAYYHSEFMTKQWSDDNNQPIGDLVVAPATWETAAYVARYVTKKLNGAAAAKYDILGIIPEFCLMSRRPGIAGDYVEKNMIGLMDFDKISVSTPYGGRSFPPPLYFKRKFDSFFDDGSIVYFNEKRDRQDESLRLMESIKQQKLDQTDLSYLDLLAVAEQEKLKKTKSLERSF